MIASELNNSHVGKMIVVGKNSKSRRKIILDVTANSSIVLVRAEGVSITTIPLNPSDEVHIEE